jgi:hypothetical protein
VAAFKDEIGTELARRLAGELTAAWPDFPRRRFLYRLAGALEPLELLARVDLVAHRLTEALPGSFPDAAGILWRALDSPTFTGWMTLPCGGFVAQRGMDHPAAALPLLSGLTPRWSSEAAIRPFLERHPGITYDHLRRWAEDPDEHVRRLVSEGTRPRLPWGAAPASADHRPVAEHPAARHAGSMTRRRTSVVRLRTTSTTSAWITPASPSISPAAGSSAAMVRCGSCVTVCAPLSSVATSMRSNCSA